MKLYILCLLLSLCQTDVQALSFEQHFCDSTLRLDYTFAGDASTQHIFLDELSITPRWYGRHYRLDELPLKGNGRLTAKDPQTGDTLYRHSSRRSFRNGWQPTKPNRLPARSRMYSWYPTPNILL